MRTEHDELWDWIWDDDDDSVLPPLERFAAGAQEPVDVDDELERLEGSLLLAVRDVDDEQPEENRDERAEVLRPPPRRDPMLPGNVATTLVVAPQRARRSARKRVRRRLLAIVLMAAIVGAATVGAVRLLSGRSAEPDATAPAPAPVAAEQRVVAFVLWDEDEGAGYLAVLTEGGGKEPVAVVFPDATSVTIPGQGLGTVASATGSGDVTVVQATVENVLGVRVDDALGIPLGELAPLVDSLGLLDLEGELAAGEDVVAYLREGVGKPGPERVARWQEVLTSLLAAAQASPDALEDVPERLRPVFTSGADVIVLPTEDIGAGLVTPDDASVEELVEDRFVPSDTGGAAARLVVLNGNGTPGVGEEVARLLVPEGFRLITSENAETFDLEETQILATSREYLDEARLARRLLGVGSVFIGGPPSGVADVTVVVGDDFGSP